MLVVCEYIADTIVVDNPRSKSFRLFTDQQIVARRARRLIKHAMDIINSADCRVYVKLQ